MPKTIGEYILGSEINSLKGKTFIDPNQGPYTIKEIINRGDNTSFKINYDASPGVFISTSLEKHKNDLEL